MMLLRMKSFPKDGWGARVSARNGEGESRDMPTARVHAGLALRQPRTNPPSPPRQELTRLRTGVRPDKSQYLTSVR
jgi:hypothetical protein